MTTRSIFGRRNAVIWFDLKRRSQSSTTENFDLSLDLIFFRLLHGCIDNRSLLFKYLLYLLSCLCSGLLYPSAKRPLHSIVVMPALSLTRCALFIFLHGKTDMNNRGLLKLLFLETSLGNADLDLVRNDRILLRYEVMLLLFLRSILADYLLQSALLLLSFLKGGASALAEAHVCCLRGSATISISS